MAPEQIDTLYATTEFTKITKMWENFNEATMGICVHQGIGFYGFFPADRDRIFSLPRFILCVHSIDKGLQYI
jgi:hypothetical protein